MILNKLPKINTKLTISHPCSVCQFRHHKREQRSNKKELVRAASDHPGNAGSDFLPCGIVAWPRQWIVRRAKGLVRPERGHCGQLLAWNVLGRFLLLEQLLRRLLADVGGARVTARQLQVLVAAARRVTVPAVPTALRVHISEGGDRHRHGTWVQGGGTTCNGGWRGARALAGVVYDSDPADGGHHDAAHHRHHDVHVNWLTTRHCDWP